MTHHDIFNQERKYNAWIEIQSEDMGSDRNGYVDMAPMNPPQKFQKTLIDTNLT